MHTFPVLPARLAAVLMLAAACTGGGQAPAESLDAGPPPLPDAGPALSVSFEPSSLTANPGDVSTVTVQVTPPGVYPIKAYIATAGATAYLDKSETTTNARGKARLQLTIQTEGNFDVGASSGGSSARLPVSVEKLATGNLIVTPEYAGARAVSQWVVRTAVDANCDDLDDYEAGVAFDESPITLEGVRAKVPIKVLVRAEHYVLGCRETVLLAGVDNSISVAMTDRPLQRSAVDFPLRFSFERTLEFTERLEALITAMRSPFDTTDQAESLLGVMSLATPDPNQFDSAATRHDWLNLTRAHLATLGESQTLLRDRVDGWLRQGTEQLFQPTSFLGHLVASSEAPGFGTFSLTSVAGLSADGLSITNQASATIDADPATAEGGEGFLRVGFRLDWSPSQMLADLASGRLGSSGAMGLSVALAAAADCSTLATTLADTEPDAECDGTCISKACEAALEGLWAQAVATRTELATLEIFAAGQPEIDEAARPIGFSGTWAGTNDFREGAPPQPIRGPFDTSELNVE